MADGVLLLHGIARTSASMRAIADLAEAIRPAVSRFAAATPGTLHAVGIP